MSCPFCNYNTDVDFILEEKKHCIILLSNPRLMPGHLLVVPKRHIESPHELKKNEKREIFDTIIEYQYKIIQNLAKGCDIRQHLRPFIKQEETRVDAKRFRKVDHLHFHLLPRNMNDELYEMVYINQNQLFKNTTKEEAEKIIQKIKTA